MDTVYLRVKEITIGALALVISILSPISTALVLLITMSIVDVFLGFKANRKVLGEEFKFNKAFNAITKMGFFCMLTVLIHLTFHLYGEIDIAAVVVKYLSWIIIYYYILNMLYNAGKIYPESKVIPFLIEVMQLHVLGAMLSRMGVNVGKVKLQEEKKGAGDENE
ncbi:hypothetical protein [Porphyromonas cangingivalis]|uniref:hypothetical protein n=1 Tax=Porphyromonas cangingivalis TaxID=36874 RepID=UPI002431B7ED|nr:hypothetical protein [Porphyromonas cangingivalis]